MAKHTIKVKAQLEDGQVVFNPQSDKWRKDTDQKMKFIFSKNDKPKIKKEDHHAIEFVIESCAELDLEFAEAPRNAMWVIAAPGGSGCPKADSKMDYSTICPTAVVLDDCRKRTILEVTNTNMKRADWAFALNFVRGQSATIDPGKSECWDPIVKNTNGGSSFAPPAPLSIAAGCVLLGATLVAGALWLKD